MSDRYYVNDNAQPNGDHEVHKDWCEHLWKANSKTDLGYHSDCDSAVRKAKTIYWKSNGCFYCVPTCHTS